MDWLCDQLCALEEQIRQADLRASDPHTDPRDAHEAAEAAKRLRIEHSRMRAARALSEQMVKTLGQLTNTLRVAGYTSRARSLAMNHLETAQLWLMTETR